MGRLIAGPAVPKEKRDPRLPDGFEQLEYLSMKNEPTAFSEIIFCNTPENVNRIKEISSIIEGVGFRYINPIPHDISVVVPTLEINKLTEDEQKRTHPYIDNSFSITQLPPRLIRFIDFHYAKALFDNGDLFLSSFNHCKTLEDNSRRDRKEGQATIKCGSRKESIEVETGIGINPLLLCVSSFQSDPKEIDCDGKYCAGFIITNPTQLIINIINGLRTKGIIVKQALFGPCHYSNRIINRELDNLPNFITGPTTMDFDKMFNFIGQMSGTDIYFEKGIEFIHEKEWRFVFISDKDYQIDNIIIHVDKPEEYCCLYHFEQNFE